MLKTHDRIFIHLDKTPVCDGWTDRQTDRQNPSSLYGGVHCDQCGPRCDVKTYTLPPNVVEIYLRMRHRPNDAVSNKTALYFSAFRALTSRVVTLFVALKRAGLLVMR